MNHTVITVLFLRLSNSCVSLRLLPDTGVLNARLWIMREFLVYCQSLHMLSLWKVNHPQLSGFHSFFCVFFRESVTVAGSPQVVPGRRDWQGVAERIHFSLFIWQLMITAESFHVIFWNDQWAGFIDGGCVFWVAFREKGQIGSPRQRVHSMKSSYLSSLRCCS